MMRHALEKKIEVTAKKSELKIQKEVAAMKDTMEGEIADLGGKVEEGFLAGAKQEDVETLKIDLGKVREDMKKEFQTINDTLGPLLSAQKTSPEATAISEDHQTPSIK